MAAHEHGHIGEVMMWLTMAIIIGFVVLVGWILLVAFKEKKERRKYLKH